MLPPAPWALWFQIAYASYYIMPRPRGPATEMVRLPVDVARALRRRAATADITIAQAARQLLSSQKGARQDLGLLEHVEWLWNRLRRRRDDLLDVFQDANADARPVDQAIDALARLREEWPEQGSEYDFTVHGAGQPM
jgi:hypothetical protein